LQSLQGIIPKNIFCTYDCMMRLEAKADLWKIAFTGTAFHKAHAGNKTSINAQKIYV